MAADLNHSRLISVIIPSFNDRSIIRPFYNAIISTLSAQTEFNYELIYVDDGSVDGSQAELAALAESDPQVVFIELFRNFGQQRALFAGLARARGEVVVCIDGDYQYEPEVILTLARALGDGYDMASGVRIGRVEGAASRFASAVGNRLICRAMGVVIRDFGSVKAFSRELVDQILAMEHCFSDVYPAAIFLRPAMVEVEVAHRKRFAGVSHWTFWMRLKLYLDLYCAYGDENFSGTFRAGALSCVFSGVVFIVFCLIKAIWFYQATYLQIAAIAFSIFFFGLVVMGWSLLMSVAIKIFRQSIFKQPYIVRKETDRRCG